MKYFNGRNVERARKVDPNVYSKTVIFREPQFDDR